MLSVRGMRSVEAVYAKERARIVDLARLESAARKRTLVSEGRECIEHFTYERGELVEYSRHDKREGAAV